MTRTPARSAIGSADAAGRDRAFREFVRTHHPDRGGDPEAFVAGLAAHRTGATRPRTDHDLVFHRRRRGVAALAAWWRARRVAARRPPRVL